MAFRKVRLKIRCPVIKPHHSWLMIGPALNPASISTGYHPIFGAAGYPMEFDSIGNCRYPLVRL